MSLPPAGAICWVNITVTDIDRAKKFYSTVFNWSFTTPTTIPEDRKDGIVYFTTPAKQMGALTVADGVGHAKLKTSNKGTAILYFIVEGLEGCLERIEKAGGKKEREAVEEGNGLLQHFEDCEGNHLGMYHQGK